MNIKLGTTWAYVGHDRHFNHHLVIDVSEGYVTTWSAPNPDGKDKEIGGWSWFGPKEDFLKAFKSVGKPPEPPKQNA